MKDILKEEEATESAVMLSVASTANDISTLLLHTLYCFQSTHFLSVMGIYLHLLKVCVASGGREK